MPDRFNCWDCGTVWGRFKEGIYVVAVKTEIECRHPDTLYPIVPPGVWAQWT